jgi:sec-independent protein translocase protein TatA
VFGLKPMEVLLIIGVLLLLFGGAKLPQLGKSLGEGIRNFKKGFTGEEETKAAAPPAAPAKDDAKLAASGGGVADAVDAAKSKQS